MSIRRVDDAYAASYTTAWGEGWVYVHDGRLVGVDLPGEGPTHSGRDAPAPGAGASHAPAGVTAGSGGVPAEPGAADSQALSLWVRELEAYFAGERTTWTGAEVPLGAMRLGGFEQAVYEALLAVPAGQTVTYGELAEMAGYPRAARAVGNAMAANPIPVVVPCHRVIRSDGTLGNYGNDPEWKERLLVHEGWVAAGSGAGAEGDGTAAREGS